MLTEDEKKFILNIVDNLNCDKEDILIGNDYVTFEILLTDKDIDPDDWVYSTIRFFKSDLKLEFKNLKQGRFTLKELGLDD
jgi:hypothetical protein